MLFTNLGVLLPHLPPFAVRENVGERLTHTSMGVRRVNIDDIDNDLGALYFYVVT